MIEGKLIETRPLVEVRADPERWRAYIRERVRITETGCWEWALLKHPLGYGRCKVGRRARLAHRVSYEAFVGPIPDGLSIDHLCRNAPCCNPDHLEAVTVRVNAARAEGPFAAGIAKHGVCPEHGPMRVVGSTWGLVHRCDECRRAAGKAYRETNREKIAAYLAATREKRLAAMKAYREKQSTRARQGRS